MRAETPSDELRVEINQGHPVASEANPVPDEWLPGLERTAPYSPDHIVPASRIRDMEGFADLTYDQQVALLNYKPNFHPMSRAANTSRGNRRFSEWTEHKRTGTQVNPALREAMICAKRRWKRKSRKSSMNCCARIRPALETHSGTK